MIRKKTASILLFQTALISLFLSRPGLNAETRTQNAARLIAQSEKFQLQVQQLHGQAEKDINAANKLRGQAEQLQLRLKVGSPEYKLAVAQYESDLKLFKGHADAYNSHIADFEKTIGSCHADENMYKAHLQEVTLHTQAFHVPDVKPPHICINLNVSEAQAAHIANTMRADQMRVVAAETDLANQENKLKQAEAESLLAIKKATNANLREQREQELAGEFGRLKQEFDLLKVEKDAINGPVAVKSNSAAVGTVHGQIKH